MYAAGLGFCSMLLELPHFAVELLTVFPLMHVRALYREVVCVA